MKINKSLVPVLKCIPAVIILVLIIAVAVFSFNDIGENANSEGLSITEKAVKRAIITCYAQEGNYPESIDYLKENYGLRISDEYTVFYNMFATNIMPDVRVERKQVDK